MNKRKLSYEEVIRWRIRLLWALIAAILIYIVVISELGGGDSRVMTRLADFASDVILFGGIIFAGYRIWYNKKLLGNDWKRNQQQLDEQDERNRYLHDKSGGIVVDILLVTMLFTTATAALFDMAVFYTALSLLLLTVGLKGLCYWFAARGI